MKQLRLFFGMAAFMGAIASAFAFKVSSPPPDTGILIDNVCQQVDRPDCNGGSQTCTIKGITYRELDQGAMTCGDALKFNPQQ